MTCIRRKISLVIDKVMGFHSQIVSEVVLKVLIKCRGTTRGIPFKVVKAMISMFCNMVSEVGILGGEHQNSIRQHHTKYQFRASTRYLLVVTVTQQCNIEVYFLYIMIV